MSQSISGSPLGIYQSYLCRDELAYQFSKRAKRAVFFPRLVCPFTGDTDLEWRISSGLGTVYATTVVPPKDKEPFNVALIDLDEGFRMMSRVEGMPAESVCIGLRVQVRFVKVAGSDHPLPVFVAAEEKKS